MPVAPSLRRDHIGGPACSSLRRPELDGVRFNVLDHPNFHDHDVCMVCVRDTQAEVSIGIDKMSRTVCYDLRSLQGHQLSLTAIRT
jgi:hypothetical protein